MKQKFIVLYLDSLSVLKPLEAVLYAFIRPYTDKGIEYVTTYKDMAEHLHLTLDQVKRTINALRSAGYMTVKRYQYNVGLATVQIVQKDTSEIVQKDTSDGSDSAKMHGQIVDFCTADSANLHFSHINNNINNNRENNNNIIPPEIEQKHTSEIAQNCTSDDMATDAQAETAGREQRRREIVLTGIIEQYKQHGNIYIPNYVTQTTVIGSLIGKVCMMMQHYGIEDTDDNFSDVWRRFLQAGYDAGDDFQREHWTLDYIDKQFQPIFNRLKNGTTKNAGSTGKGERRVSDDYLRGLMQQAGINI